MSLRINLYGWSTDAFKKVLGSGNVDVLMKAEEKLATFLQEPQLSHGMTWLRTLIHKGYPMREQRGPVTVPEDGGPVTLRMETETHVFVVHAVGQAIAGTGDLDLSLESSNWKHQAILALRQEILACRFLDKYPRSREFWGWGHGLLHGTPLFGDDFRTEWSFYAIFQNGELKDVAELLRAAIAFERKLPEGILEEARKRMAVGLSKDGKQFAGELAGWFERIQETGRDAFILWR
jgi:hypothetical protein